MVFQASKTQAIWWFWPESWKSQGIVFNNIAQPFELMISLPFLYIQSKDISKRQTFVRIALELCLKFKFWAFNSSWPQVMPHIGDINLGQHWLRLWLVTWQHQAITWTNVDLWSVKSCGIHLRAVSQEVNLIHNMCSEITLLKLFATTLRDWWFNT